MQMSVVTVVNWANEWFLFFKNKIQIYNLNTKTFGQQLEQGRVVSFLAICMKSNYLLHLYILKIDVFVGKIPLLSKLLENVLLEELAQMFSK